MSISLTDRAWPDIDPRSALIVPLGSTEQHGPHLPFSTDAVIAEAVAARAGRLWAEATGRTVVVAPAINFGASGEHQGFAGTLSIGEDALSYVLIELVRSASLWAARVVIINGHGGNLRVLTQVVPQLKDEGHDVSWMPAADQMRDAHAGIDETSIMLSLVPSSVQMDRAALGDTTSVAELMPALRAGGLIAVTSNGVLGDPRGATAALGRQLLDRYVDTVAQALRDGEVDQQGRLRHRVREGSP